MTTTAEYHKRRWFLRSTKMTVGKLWKIDSFSLYLTHGRFRIAYKHCEATAPHPVDWMLPQSRRTFNMNWYHVRAFIRQWNIFFNSEDSTGLLRHCQWAAPALLDYDGVVKRRLKSPWMLQLWAIYDYRDWNSWDMLTRYMLHDLNFRQYGDTMITHAGNYLCWMRNWQKAIRTSIKSL